MVNLPDHELVDVRGSICSQERRRIKYEKVVIKPKEHRTKSMLREKDLDGAIVSSPENFHYVTGFAGHQHAASRQSGSALTVISSNDKTATQLTTTDYEELTFEKRTREQREKLGEEASEFVVRPYDTWVGVKTRDEITGTAKTVDKQSMESFFDMLKKMVRDMSLAHKKLGVELVYLNVPHFRQLQKTFPEAESVDISSMFVLARNVKAEDKIQMFHTLCRIVDEGFYQVSRMARPGAREREMADCPRQSVITTGFCVPSSWSMFPTDPSGARLTFSEDGIIESTHVAKYDAGANVEFDFYIMDTSRTWIMKDAAPELSRLKDRLYEGQRRMTVAARPGPPVCELFRTAYEYVKEWYPCCRRGHRGHSINLGPATAGESYIDASAERFLEPGMALAMEVPCYTQGVNGFNIRGMVLITEDGSEVLAPKTPHYLQGISHFKTI